MTPTPTSSPSPDERDIRDIAHEVVARVLARAGTALDDGDTVHTRADGSQLDLDERSALRRVAGLSTELQDVSEVEYRQLRLERVVLVGMWSPTRTQDVPHTAEDAEISLRELAALAHTAGSQVLDGVIQRRIMPDPGTYLGSGKAEELAEVVAVAEADTVIVDGELAPSQRRALEDIVKVKVIDRTALILDIFAQHAKSREGKAQVELAQLEYLLPRLRGWGDSMSRQAGGQVGGAGAGMGSRGPGETKIELDRRRIRDRMAKLRREIRAMAPARATKRASRARHHIPSVVLVGYTNAGKSSLLNALTGAGVLVENALFATLDPTVRRAQTDDGRVFTVADTVGFVRALPHQLVEAFRSTLEEVAEADVLLHLVDGTHPNPLSQIQAVRTVLADIPGADQVPEIVVINKADRANPHTVAEIRRAERDTIVISAHTGAGLDELRDLVADRLPLPGVDIDLVIPYDRGDLVNRVHQFGQIAQVEHTPSGTHLRARVDEGLAAELSAAANAKPIRFP